MIFLPESTAPTAPMRAFRRTCANGALLCANGAPHAGGCGGALCAPPPLTTVGVPNELQIKMSSKSRFEGGNR